MSSLGHWVFYTIINSQICSVHENIGVCWQVAGLASVVEAAAGKQSELETKFRSTMFNVHDKLRSLTERREIAQQELTR